MSHTTYSPEGETAGRSCLARDHTCSECGSPAVTFIGDHRPVCDKHWAGPPVVGDGMKITYPPDFEHWWAERFDDADLDHKAMMSIAWEEAREFEVARQCKLVCEHCRENRPIHPDHTDFHLWHDERQWECMEYCQANAIRARGAK